MRALARHAPPITSPASDGAVDPGAARPGLVALPPGERLELPLLQDLAATGGSDEGRHLAGRLLAYFPKLHPPLDAPLRRRWLRLLQRAAQRLEARGELTRAGRALVLTGKGRLRLGAEALRPEPPAPSWPPTTEPSSASLPPWARCSAATQSWSTTATTLYGASGGGPPRLSHVFEVQVAGSVDSALTRLKRAHEAQRSRLFLVITDERSAAFARRRLERTFPELHDVVTLLGARELGRLHAALLQHRDLLRQLLGI